MPMSWMMLSETVVPVRISLVADRVAADRRAVRRAVLLDSRGLGRVGGQRIVGAAQQDGGRGDVGELVALDEGVRRAVHHAQAGAAESGEPVTGERDVVGRGERHVRQRLGQRPPRAGSRPASENVHIPWLVAPVIRRLLCTSANPAVDDGAFQVA